MGLGGGELMFKRVKKLLVYATSNLIDIIPCGPKGPLEKYHGLWYKVSINELFDFKRNICTRFMHQWDSWIILKKFF